MEKKTKKNMYIFQYRHVEAFLYSGQTECKSGR